MLNSLMDRFFIRRGWVVAVQLEKMQRAFAESYELRIRAELEVHLPGPA